MFFYYLHFGAGAGAELHGRAAAPPGQRSAGAARTSLMTVGLYLTSHLPSLLFIDRVGVLMIE